MLGVVAVHPQLVQQQQVHRAAAAPVVQELLIHIQVLQ
jgi:hypothetical protein